MIGIIAPYSHCEATAAAIRIAELCLAHGEQPRLMAVGPCRMPVHSYWDQQVWSTREADGRYLGAQDCDRFVHIWNGFVTHTMATLVALEAKHILVPCWQHLTAQDLYELNLFQKVVCPSKDLFDFLSKNARCAMTASTLTWTRFDSGLPYAAVERDGPLHIAVLCNGATIDASGLGVLRCIEALLVSYDIAITLLHSRSWPENDRRNIRRLQSTYPRQFHTRRLGSFTDLNRRLPNYDWTVIPWPHADFGIAAARSLACGVPVVCYDVAPFNEIVRHEHHGHLIRCELSLSPDVEAPSAVPDTDALIKLCLELFQDRTAWHDCRRRDWKVEQHAKSFTNAWAEILGLN